MIQAQLFGLFAFVIGIATQILTVVALIFIIRACNKYLKS